MITRNILCCVYVTGQGHTQPCGSEAQLTESSHSMLEAVDSFKVHHGFPSSMTFDGFVGPQLGSQASKSECFLVPPSSRQIWGPS